MGGEIIYILDFIGNSNIELRFALQNFQHYIYTILLLWMSNNADIIPNCLWNGHPPLLSSGVQGCCSPWAGDCNYCHAEDSNPVSSVFQVDFLFCCCCYCCCCFPQYVNLKEKWKFCVHVCVCVSTKFRECMKMERLRQFCDIHKHEV